jgi:putative transposase
MSDSLRSPPPARSALPHGIPSWVKADAIFFITLNCEPRHVNQLCQPPVASVIYETVQFRQDRGDWFMPLLLLMPDHLHALVSFASDRVMKKIISNWKEIIAKKAAVSWQRDFFDHRLRAEESYDEKAHYIRMNPVRAGLAAKSEDWSFVWSPH